MEISVQVQVTNAPNQKAQAEACKGGEKGGEQGETSPLVGGQ